jgi:hypothetical protein
MLKEISVFLFGFFILLCTVAGYIAGQKLTSEEEIEKKVEKILDKKEFEEKNKDPVKKDFISS